MSNRSHRITTFCLSWIIHIPPDISTPRGHLFRSRQPSVRRGSSEPFRVWHFLLSVRFAQLLLHSIRARVHAHQPVASCQRRIHNHEVPRMPDLRVNRNRCHGRMPGMWVSGNRELLNLIYRPLSPFMSHNRGPVGRGLRRNSSPSFPREPSFETGGTGFPQ